MIEVRVVVEGETERAFVKMVLAPHFSERLHIWPVLVDKPGQPGGAPRWPVAKRDICRHLKSGGGRRAVHVTTMFDYYGMPDDWPSRAAARTKTPAERAPTIEAAMRVEVAAQLGTDFDSCLFLPHVQMHELESLLFTDVHKLEAAFPERGREVKRLAVETAGLEPEEINDDPTTAPSHRITAHIPEYRRAKVRAAPPTLREIGMSALRARCPHFASWIERLESLAPTAPNR